VHRTFDFGSTNLDKFSRTAPAPKTTCVRLTHSHFMTSEVAIQVAGVNQKVSRASTFETKATACEMPHALKSRSLGTQ
jgi:hypothetical protein